MARHFLDSANRPKPLSSNIVCTIGIGVVWQVKFSIATVEEMIVSVSYRGKQIVYLRVSLTISHLQQ